MATTPVVPVPVEIPAPLPGEEIEDESLTEIEAVSEQLALHSIESESRHEEIIEREQRIEECLQRLEASQSQTENPVMQAAITDLATLKTEVAELKGMIAGLAASLAGLSHLARQTSPSESREPNQPEIPVENPSEQSAAQLTEEPAPVESQRRKHKVI